MVTGIASPNPLGGRDWASDLCGPGTLVWGGQRWTRPATGRLRRWLGGYTPTA